MCFTTATCRRRPRQPRHVIQPAFGAHYGHRPRAVVQIGLKVSGGPFRWRLLVRQQKVFGLVILLTGILINAHQAEAGLRFCNQGTFKLTTAVGYVDRRKGWVAKGWLSLEPGECKDALRFRLDNRYYYYHAVGHDEGAHVRYDGEHPFCIESRHFTVYQANYGKSTDEECAKDGLRSAKFLKIDVE